MAFIKSTNSSKSGEDVKEKESPDTVGGNVN
jgi:hypothetical protein